MPFMVASAFIGIGFETTRGTAVSPTAYLPVEVPTWAPDITWLQDMGLRGSPANLYAEQAGVRVESFEMKGKVYLDTIPYILVGALGSSDTVTGSGPYTHVIGLYNSIAAGSQPPSMTIVYFTAGEAGPSTARQITGAQLTDLSFSFNADGALEWTGKFLGYPSTTVAKPSQSFSTEQFVPGWDCAVTINSTSNAVTETAQIDIKRDTEKVFTAGTQGPHSLFDGPADVSGKATFVLESGDTTFANATSRVTLPIDLVFTEAVSGHTLDLHMTQCQLQKPSIKGGKKYYEIDTEFMAEANTTDAVGGGFSPIKTTTVNAVSAAYH